MADVSAKSDDLVKVQVLRDLWGENEQRFLGPYEEYTGETFFDPEKNRIVQRIRTVPGQVIEMEREKARRFIKLGVVEAYV